jgi:hypothetical protein
MATGSIKIRGDGPGMITLPGDSLRSTMAAGSASAVIGDGRRAPTTVAGDAPFTHPLWCHGMAVDLDLVLDGVRWASASRSSRGITTAGDISGASTFLTLASTTSSAFTQASTVVSAAGIGGNAQ